MLINHLGYSLAVYLIMLVVLLSTYKASSRFKSNFYHLLSDLMTASSKMLALIALTIIAIWMKNDNFIDFMIHVAIFMSYLQAVVIAVLLIHGIKDVGNECN